MVGSSGVETRGNRRPIHQPILPPKSSAINTAKNSLSPFPLCPLTFPNPIPYFPDMEQFFLCACCGEENDITIDQLEGGNQEFVQDCSVCCRPNVIIARFNYHTNEFDLEVYQEDVG